jgi:hypothetical protein
MINWDVPKRYLRMTLYRGDKNAGVMNKLTEEVGVKLNTSESVSGALNEANITINGLLVENMFYLATSTTQWIQNWIQNRIVINAGYYGQSGIIFDGVVFSAKPNLERADYGITLKCMSMFSDLTENKSYSFAGQIPVSQIAQKLAADMGLKFVDEVKDDSIVINNYTLRDQNAVNGLRLLSQMTGLDIYSSGNRVYMKKRGESISSARANTITTQDIIGVPEPTDTGVIINVRLNPGIRTGQAVFVDSLKYPQLKSYKFFLSTLSHVADTRGRDWYTRLNLTKEGLGWYQ